MPALAPHVSRSRHSRRARSLSRLIPVRRVAVSFYMPSKYTAETLPLPNNARVTIKEVPEHVCAAITFRCGPVADLIQTLTYSFTPPFSAHGANDLRLATRVGSCSGGSPNEQKWAKFQQELEKEMVRSPSPGVASRHCSLAAAALAALEPERPFPPPASHAPTLSALSLC